MELESVARRVDDVGAALVDAGGRIGAVHPPVAAGGPGAFGEVSRALSGQVANAIAARAAEARALGASATDLATAVLQATSSYRGTDAGRGGA